MSQDPVRSGGLAALLASAPSFTATQTITLDIPGMDCPVCPITLKQALHNVTGVGQTTVNVGQRQATVSFDDAQTTVDALIKAATDAGYASTLKK